MVGGIIGCSGSPAVCSAEASVAKVPSDICLAEAYVVSHVRNIFHGLGRAMVPDTNTPQISITPRKERSRKNPIKWTYIHI